MRLLVRLGLAATALLASGGVSARILLVQTSRGPVWTNVPEPAGTRLPRPTTRRDPYRTLIREAASAHAVDSRLVEAIIACESDFDADAVSSAGAEGLMQLMPDTQARYGVSDAFDVAQNIDAGTRHLRDLLAEFGSDWKLVAAAYNAGSGAVRRARGIPPYPETVHYVRKVQHYLRALGVGMAGEPVAPVAEIAEGLSFTGGGDEPPGPAWREPAPPEETEPVRPRGPKAVMVRDERGRVTFTNRPAATRGAGADEARR